MEGHRQYQGTRRGEKIGHSCRGRGSTTSLSGEEDKESDRQGNFPGLQGAKTDLFREGNTFNQGENVNLLFGNTTEILLERTREDRRKLGRTPEASNLAGWEDGPDSGRERATGRGLPNSKALGRIPNF